MTITTKRCPSCAGSLPHSSFGPDRTRPPLFLQGRCRSCTAQAKRDSRKPATWEADLADTIARMEALPVAAVRQGVPGIGTVSVLALPALRGRGRMRREYPAGRDEALWNWLGMIDGRREPTRLCDKTPRFAIFSIARSLALATRAAAP